MDPRARREAMAQALLAGPEDMSASVDTIPQDSGFLQKLGNALATMPSAQAIKSAVTLPGDVYAGRQPMGLPSETEDLSRVADLAGLAMTGGIAGAPKGAVGSGPIRAYHGSPHDFDKFSLEHIGKGEGAQAYGHGLYFAESPAVAAQYQQRLAKTPGDIPPDAQAIAAMRPEWDALVQQFRASLAPDQRHTPETAKIQALMDALHQKAVDDTISRTQPHFGGRMYEVGIHADPDKLLDWDKSLGQQRGLLDEIVGRHGGEASARQAFKDFDALSTEVLAAPKGSPQYERAMQDWDAAQRDPRTKLGDILGRLDQPKSAYGYDPAAKTTGETLYRGLDRGDRAAASQVFLDAGIPGIKYLDAGSRAHGDGSRNYVVFDDQIVEILKKYGVASIAALPPAIQMAIELGKPSATSGEKP
jgi:hypothetical protein